MKHNKFLSLTIVIVIIALTAAVSGCGAVESAKVLNQTGNDFMTALKDGDFDAAYNLCVAELQTEIGTVDDLAAMIDDSSARPQEWKFSSWNVTTDANQNNIATVEGTVTYQDGRTGAVTLELIKVGEAWEVMSFNLTW